MTSDKRSHQRFLVNLPARCKIAGPAHPTFFSTILDISPSGICFESGVKVDTGTEIVFQAELGERGRVTIKTKVVWVKASETPKQWKAGVTILNASDEDEKRFVQYYCDKVFIRPEERIKKILVVEDKKEESQFIRNELQGLPYQVLYAVDGQEGLGKYRLENPDLIIVDERAPKMGGRELCQKIRGTESDHHTAIIFLTDRREGVDKSMGRTIGADCYLVKPVDVKGLRKAVVELLRIG